MGRLINIDNGGTLTDICVIDGEQIFHTKTLTTPYDLSKCFLEGLKKASVLLYGEERVVDLLLSTDHIRYSTTQGTNAIVERKGPRLGLIVSADDDIDRLRTGDTERELFDAMVGRRVATLDVSLEDSAFDMAIVAGINRLTAMGAHRIVVSLQGADGAKHEIRVKDTTLRKFPRQLLGVVPLLCGTDLIEDGNFIRRTWTAMLNAYLHPTMEAFLYHAEGILRDYHHQHPLLIFRNDGDSARVARTVALKTYSSGPRGGMEGARALAQHYGFKRMLSMDIGGTTTDIGLVEHGAVVERRRGCVEGLPVSLPLCEVASIGVGGSSILRADDGQIRVGPESAGGAPGPACYGLGGQQPTITDVLLLTGLIDDKTYFDGAMALDGARAQSAVKKQLAEPLALDIATTLEKAEQAWVGKVAMSLAKHTTLDEETVLAAFGGAGPFLLTDIAAAAGLQEAIIPGLAAVFSAYGIGFSDIAQQYQRRVTDLSVDAADGMIESLIEAAERDMFAEGFELEACRLEWSLVREQGDQVERREWSPGLAFPPDALDCDATFVELRVVRPIAHASLGDSESSASVEAVIGGTRRAWVPGQGEQDLPVYALSDQPAGATARGPCVIEESFFTCRVGSGWVFRINANRDTRLSRI